MKRRQKNAKRPVLAADSDPPPQEGTAAGRASPAHRPVTSAEQSVRKRTRLARGQSRPRPRFAATRCVPHIDSVYHPLLSPLYLYGPHVAENLIDYVCVQYSSPRRRELSGCIQVSISVQAVTSVRRWRCPNPSLTPWTIVDSRVFDLTFR